MNDFAITHHHFCQICPKLLRRWVYYIIYFTKFEHFMYHPDATLSFFQHGFHFSDFFATSSCRYPLFENLTIACYQYSWLSLYNNFFLSAQWLFWSIPCTVLWHSLAFNSVSMSSLSVRIIVKSMSLVFNSNNLFSIKVSSCSSLVSLFMSFNNSE